LLTVSVLVNALAPGVRDDTGALQPNIKEQIEGIVKQSVGFLDTRDFINVEFLPFLESPPEEEPAQPGFPWEQVNLILKNVSLGLAAVVALVLGWMALRKLRPVTVPISPGGQLPAERANYVSQLSDLVKQHPEVFSKILESWSTHSATSGKSSTATTANQKNERRAA
jgi:flagellar biosynthesis/type III secretory pathway M-ring protein FliF/YscJ